MSVRIIQEAYCDVCGNADIVKTTMPIVGFGGKILWRECGFDDPESDRKRRDYCEKCVESDKFYCETCQTPHQFECPVDVAALDAAMAASASSAAAERGGDECPF